MPNVITLDFSNTDAARTLFDQAFEHPENTYIVQPIDTDVARAWLQENAFMLNFGWATDNTFQTRLQRLGAMYFYQVIGLDTLYYRNRCGWQADDEEGDNNGYLCDYPPDMHTERCSVTGNRLCHTWQCPIAYQADREDIRLYDPSSYASDYANDPEQEPEDEMVLIKRPRYAYVPNVHVLGCEDSLQ